MLRTHGGKQVIAEKKYPTAVHLIEFRKTDQITEIAPIAISELQSNISTMVQIRIPLPPV